MVSIKIVFLTSILGMMALGISLYLFFINIRLERNIKKQEKLLIKKEQELKEKLFEIRDLHEKLVRKENVITKYVQQLMDLKAILAEKNQLIQQYEKRSVSFTLQQK